MHNYEEIKKLIKNSKKILESKNDLIKEDYDRIKKIYNITEDELETGNISKKINVAKSIEQNIKKDDEESNRDKQQSYRVSGGIITLHGKEQAEIELTTEEKTFFQETMDEFVQEVSDLSDFGILNVYKNSVEWSGNIIEFDLEFFFTIGEDSGVYINAETMKLDPQALELLNKLSGFYQKFKSKWAQVLANRKKTKKQ